MGFQRWYTVIPVLGLLVLALCCVLFARMKANLSLREKLIAFCRAIPFACLLLFVCVWFALGKVSCGPVFLSGVTFVFTLLGSLSVFRGHLLSTVSVVVSGHSVGSNASPSHPEQRLAVARNILLLILAAVYSYVVLDILWNDAFFAVQFGFALMGIVALLIIYLFLYFLGQGTCVGFFAGRCVLHRHRHRAVLCGAV